MIGQISFYVFQDLLFLVARVLEKFDNHLWKPVQAGYSDAEGDFLAVQIIVYLLH